MKTLTTALSGLMLTSLIFSCQKEDLTSPDQLQLDLESCKPKDKKELFIGKEYQGGIIFYLDETGKHGLIAAKEDLGPAPWGCYGTSIPGAQSYSDGKANTRAILQNCPEKGIAARLCHKYSVCENGKVYDDWFMPSWDQFFLIMKELKSSSGLCNHSHLVSTEAYGTFMAGPIDPTKSAWHISLNCPPDEPVPYARPYIPLKKSYSSYVRPIRKF